MDTQTVLSWITSDAKEEVKVTSNHIYPRQTSKMHWSKRYLYNISALWLDWEEELIFEVKYTSRVLSANAWVYAEVAVVLLSHYVQMLHGCSL